FFFSSRRRHKSSTRDWSAVVCSSDLHVVISACPESVDLWDVDSGKQLQKLPIQGGYWQVALAPHNKSLAIMDGSVWFWDLTRDQDRKSVVRGRVVSMTAGLRMKIEDS